MTFKDFIRGYNYYRATNPCLDLSIVVFTESIITIVKQFPFWEREKVWQDYYKFIFMLGLIIRTKNSEGEEVNNSECAGQDR